MEIEIARVGASDIGVLRRVADDVFDRPIDFPRAGRYLAGGGNVLIVALADGVVVGQVQAVLHRHLDAPDDMFIDNLGVAPAWRRHGIARRLIAAAREAGCEAGASEAWVLAERGDAPARAAYAAAGAISRAVVMFSMPLAASNDAAIADS